MIEDLMKDKIKQYFIKYAMGFDFNFGEYGRDMSNLLDHAYWRSNIDQLGPPDNPYYDSSGNPMDSLYGPDGLLKSTTGQQAMDFIQENPGVAAGTGAAGLAGAYGLKRMLSNKLEASRKAAANARPPRTLGLGALGALGALGTGAYMMSGNGDRDERQR